MIDATKLHELLCALDAAVTQGASPWTALNTIASEPAVHDAVSAYSCLTHEGRHYAKWAIRMQTPQATALLERHGVHAISFVEAVRRLGVPMPRVTD